VPSKRAERKAGLCRIKSSQNHWKTMLFLHLPPPGTVQKESGLTVSRNPSKSIGKTTISTFCRPCPPMSFQVAFSARPWIPTEIYGKLLQILMFLRVRARRTVLLLASALAGHPLPDGSSKTLEKHWKYIHISIII
jgi:hypothetical protein